MPVTLRATLCDTRDVLHVLRKSVFTGGHMQAMERIDSLIGVAEDEAVHAINAIDRVEVAKPVRVEPESQADPIPAMPLPRTLVELRGAGMALNAYCGNARCGHLSSLNLDDLIELYGTHYDFGTERRLASKLTCKRCQQTGGKLAVVSDRRARY